VAPKERRTEVAKEQTLEEWVSDMTVAHNNHAKAIEVLELRERNLNDRLDRSDTLADDQRKAINKLMEHFGLTLEG
jgi:hypothetical protein